jgi:hypothetical protein
MTLPASLVAEVQRRAGGTCEYCGVTEVASGGELSVDHYRPTSQGGTDELDNLVYACFRCNLYKAAYWADGGELALWNPRVESFAVHFVEAEDGTLLGRTPVGVRTVEVLRLNRPLLVANRSQRRARAEAARRRAERREVTRLLITHQQEKLSALRRQVTWIEQEIELLRRILETDTENN